MSDIWGAGWDILMPTGPIAAINSAVRSSTISPADSLRLRYALMDQNIERDVLIPIRNALSRSVVYHTH